LPPGVNEVTDKQLSGVGKPDFVGFSDPVHPIFILVYSVFALPYFSSLW